MIRYFDASALVKRYVVEKASRAVADLLGRDTPATARCSLVELTSALCRRVREGSLSREVRDRLVRSVLEDAQRLLVVELTPEVAERAMDLLARHELRAGDAVQLASCLTVRERVGGDVELVAFDDRLNGAAEAEGLRVVAPRS